MFTIRPQPRSIIPSITWRVTLNTEFRLVLITAYQSFGDMRLNTPSRVIPALFTSTSIGPIDVLVNNAGITRDGVFKRMSPNDWYAVINTNLNSVFNVTRQVIEGMMERGWGRIVNISSVNALKGQFGQTNYSAAKAGMHGFTKALAQEVVKKGVTVNTISPGYVDTDMVRAIKTEVLDSIVSSIPMGRLARPEEIAGLVSYLSSDDAGYITGANISINGGLHME